MLFIKKSLVTLLSSIYSSQLNHLRNCYMMTWFMCIPYLNIFNQSLLQTGNINLQPCQIQHCLASFSIFIFIIMNSFCTSVFPNPEYLLPTFLLIFAAKTTSMPVPENHPFSQLPSHLNISYLSCFFQTFKDWPSHEILSGPL